MEGELEEVTLQAGNLSFVPRDLSGRSSRQGAPPRRAATPPPAGQIESASWRVLRGTSRPAPALTADAIAVDPGAIVRASAPRLVRDGFGPLAVFFARLEDHRADGGDRARARLRRLGVRARAPPGPAGGAREGRARGRLPARDRRAQLGERTVYLAQEIAIDLLLAAHGPGDARGRASDHGVDRRGRLPVHPGDAPLGELRGGDAAGSRSSGAATSCCARRSGRRRSRRSARTATCSSSRSATLPSSSCCWRGRCTTRSRRSGAISNGRRGSRQAEAAPRAGRRMFEARRERLHPCLSSVTRGAGSDAWGRAIPSRYPVGEGGNGALG